MTTDQAKKLILTDPDFVYSKKYGYSLTKLLERYPDGVPDKIIAQALLMTEDDVQELYDRVVKRLRELMAPELDTIDNLE